MSKESVDVRRRKRRRRRRRFHMAHYLPGKGEEEGHCKKHMLHSWRSVSPASHSHASFSRLCLVFF